MKKALRQIVLAGFSLAMSVAAGFAATKPSPPPASPSTIQTLPGTSSKEPIPIDADNLVYYDKEKKAVYSGNVVVIQGNTKMTCSVMTVFLDRSPAPGANVPDDAQGGSSP